MSPGKYRQSYYTDKYDGTFELLVPYKECLINAQVRPSNDKTFYTVNLNWTFFAHLSKDAEGWKDMAGLRSEEISVIGKKIEEYLRNI